MPRLRAALYSASYEVKSYLGCFGRFLLWPLFTIATHTRFTRIRVACSRLASFSAFLRVSVSSATNEKSSWTPTSMPFAACTGAVEAAPSALAAGAAATRIERGRRLINEIKRGGPRGDAVVRPAAGRPGRRG